MPPAPDPVAAAPGGRCPYCGRPILAGDRYCAGCGASATDPAGAPPPPVGPAAPTGPEGSAWSRLAPILWIFGLFLGGDLVTSRVDQAAARLWLQIVLYGLAALATVVMAARHRVRLGALLGVPRLSGRGAARLLGLALAGSLFLVAYFALLERIGVPLLDETIEFRVAGWPLWSVFLLGALVPAVVEEAAFRGVILEILTPVLAPRDALIVQAALFGVLHLLPMIFVSHFIVGLICGWMRLRSGSLYPSMIFHAAWNGFAIAIALHSAGVA